MTATPAASAVVVNWNGGAALVRCLEALVGQTLQPLEVILVDNASSDGSVSSVSTRWPAISVLSLAANTGFAAAVNRGVRAASAPLILTLNYDVILTPTYLAEVAQVLAGQVDVGWGQGLLLRGTPEAPTGLVDSAGHEIFRNRWVRSRAEDRAYRPQDYPPVAEVWGATAAAAVYRRAMLDDLAIRGNVFEPSYFMYLEDVDLDWRARWRGWRCLLASSAIAYHARSGSGAWPRAEIQRRILANRYRTLLRNDHGPDFLRHLLEIALFDLAKFLQLLLTHPSALLGYLDAARSLPETLRARRALRARRRVPIAHLSRWFQPVPYREWMHPRALLGKRRAWTFRSLS
jgi:GT2 family glycosyltransferase